MSTVTADRTGKIVLLTYSLTASRCSTEAHLAGVPFPRSFDSHLVRRQSCSALLVRAPASRTGIPGSRPAPTSCGSMWTRGSYIGAVTRTGVRFRGVSVTDVAMPVRAVCKTSLS